MKIKNLPAIENFNQKLKNSVGEDFSRFRVWAIAIEILTMNLGFCIMRSELN
jgi:hypothetical protein